MNEDLKNIIIAKEIIFLLNYKDLHSTDKIAIKNHKNGELICTFFKIEDLIKDLTKDFNPFVYINNLRNDSSPFLIELCLTAINEYNEEVQHIINTINKENLSLVSQDEKNSILETCLNYDFYNIIEVFFKNGFRLQEGDDQYCLECQAAENLKERFFKIVNQYQPDFNWQKKYKIYGRDETYEMTLLQYLEHIYINSSTKNLTGSKKDRFEMSWETLQKFTLITSYNTLKENLVNKDEKKRLKI